MIKKISSVVSVVIASIFIVTLCNATSVFAADPQPEDLGSDACTGSHFLGLRAWYDGLASVSSISHKCEVPSEKFNRDNITTSVWLIVLNVTSMITGIVGYLAICFVIWGGYQYMLAQGDPGKVVRGKKTIMNAIIGLVVCQLASIISGMVADIASEAKGENIFIVAMNKAFTWAAIIAVIVIVVGGIQYVVSNGNPSAVQKAKQTIMYAAIGLVISLLAVAIVNFAIKALF